MGLKNNQWQHEGLQISGSYARITKILWEAGGGKNYYEEDGTLRERANMQVKLLTLIRMLETLCHNLWLKRIILYRSI